MSTKTKFYTLLTGMLFLGTISFAQVATIEMTSGTPTNGAYSLTVPGSGFGPRTTDHVVTFVQDVLNNSNFTPYTLAAPAPPSVTATIALRNQQYTGLTYGAATPNAVSTGLLFGAGPSLSTGGIIQQATPLNSYDIMGSFNGSGGPTNSMFTSNLAVPGAGIDATGDAFGNDINSGAQVFTTAQVLYDLNKPYATANRYYYGDLVITFNRLVVDPVIHLAGLGGSYRYLPIGQPDLPANYLSTFFSTELDYQGVLPLSKLSGNAFLTVSGSQILNNAAAPNGGSVVVPNSTFNNYGAATGSVKITGAVRSVTFKVYLRGSNASQFGWASAGIGVVQGATRAPLTGDIWFISVSAEKEQLIPFPITGARLTAALTGNNDVALSWKTISEYNSKQFEIERSTDGVNFTKIGIKPAAGYSNSEKSYADIDPSMSVSIYYYRLKMVDIDAKFTYSNIAVVRKAGGIKTIRSFPNPAINEVNLEFSNAKGDYAITMYSQAGQEVYTKQVSIDFPVQYVNMERGKLAAGSYIISIKNTGTNEKFVQNVIFQ